MVAWVDEQDAERVRAYRWYPSPQATTTYAITRINQGGKRTSLYMHRLIMQPQADQQVDHINGNGLDNRRSNLRVCSLQQNLRNTGNQAGSTSCYKGVYWKKSVGRWVARISVEGKQRHLGYFRDEEEAACAYDRAARIAYGEYARLNFPA
ncbi:MAG TPA: AP2 domain-containing protein [Chthonomonadaceae bacterium]|nr:AP2 domain-containing protein [Chthonomonadaceae bacterium]